jgi:hypothetical protein
MPAPTPPPSPSWWRSRLKKSLLVYVHATISTVGVTPVELYVLMSEATLGGDKATIELGPIVGYPLKHWYARFDPDAHPPTEPVATMTQQEPTPPVDPAKPLEDYTDEEVAAISRQPISAYSPVELLAIAQVLKFHVSITDKPELLAQIAGKPVTEMTAADMQQAQEFLNHHRAHLKAGTPAPAADELPPQVNGHDQGPAAELPDAPPGMSAS